MDQFQYRMNNKVNERIKDSLKGKIMNLILSQEWYYLDREDFVEVLLDLADEIDPVDNEVNALKACSKKKCDCGKPIAG